MQRSSKQVTPKRDLLPLWFPPLAPPFPVLLPGSPFVPQLGFSAGDTLGYGVLQLTGGGVSPGLI